MEISSKTFRTQFQVSLFHTITDPVPFTTIPITAKMPLGAMVFALQRMHIASVARVDVTYGEEQTTFYHVVVDSEHIRFDREVLVEGDAEDEPG